MHCNHVWQFKVSIYVVNPKDAGNEHRANSCECAYAVHFKFMSVKTSWVVGWFYFPIISCSLYLLGLLAKIKCSISSSQPDLWDLEYISSIIWLGTFMKPHWSHLVVVSSESFVLGLPADIMCIETWPRYCSTSESRGHFLYLKFNQQCVIHQNIRESLRPFPKRKQLIFVEWISPTLIRLALGPFDDVWIATHSTWFKAGLWSAHWIHIRGADVRGILILLRCVLFHLCSLQRLIHHELIFRLLLKVTVDWPRECNWYPIYWRDFLTEILYFVIDFPSRCEHHCGCKRLMKRNRYKNLAFIQSHNKMKVFKKNNFIQPIIAPFLRQKSSHLLRAFKESYLLWTWVPLPSLKGSQTFAHLSCR